MRMERYLRKKRKRKAIRVLVSLQIMFTFLLISLTASSYALFTDREQIHAGTFATSFVFTKTIDDILRHSTVAGVAAAGHEQSAKHANQGCHELALEEAKKKAATAKHEAALAEQAVNKAQAAVVELDGYLEQADEAINELREEIEERLRDESEKSAQPFDEELLIEELNKDERMQEIARLRDYIKKAISEANKTANRAVIHAKNAKKATNECDELIGKKQMQNEQKDEKQQGMEPDKPEQNEKIEQTQPEQQDEENRSGNATDPKQPAADGVNRGKEGDSDQQQGKQVPSTTNKDNVTTEGGL